MRLVLTEVGEAVEYQLHDMPFRTDDEHQFCHQPRLPAQFPAGHLSLSLSGVLS